LDLKIPIIATSPTGEKKGQKGGVREYYKARIIRESFMAEFGLEVLWKKGKRKICGSFCCAKGTLKRYSV